MNKKTINSCSEDKNSKKEAGKFKKWLKCTNGILPFILAVIAILQCVLAFELGNIQKSTEKEKILNARKELREISRNIFGSFSYKGINERQEHTTEENIALARKLYGLLLEGSANPLLSHDSESLKHWYKAISAIEFYDYDVSTKSVVIQKEDGKTLPASDTEVNGMVVDSLTTSYQEAMQAYLRLGLTSYELLNDLEHKSKIK